MAQEQRQWEQAREYFLKALGTYVEYGDEHNMGIAFRSSAQLWQKSKDDSLPAAIAQILETTPEKVEEMMRERV